MPSLPSQLEDVDDQILVGRAVDGDVAAFEVLLRRHAPVMTAYARQILPGSAEVDDVVQEAFIVAWERLDEIEDAARVRSWLLRITSRKAIDRIRAARPQSDITDLDLPGPEQTAPHRRAEAAEGIAALDAALQQLPAQQRACWVLREMGGYAYDEIAAELDLPTATVRGLLARARKNIMIRMEEWR